MRSGSAASSRCEENERMKAETNRVESEEEHGRDRFRRLEARVDPAARVRTSHAAQRPFWMMLNAGCPRSTRAEATQAPKPSASKHRPAVHLSEPFRCCHDHHARPKSAVRVSAWPSSLLPQLDRALLRAAARI